MSSTPAWIDLDGAVNVRDLAGTPAVGGQVVQPGRLIRADNLQDLSPADVRRLVDEIGVRSVVDLRTHVEVDGEGPGPILNEPQVTVHHLSLIPEVGPEETSADNPAILPWQARREDEAGDVARRGAGAVYLRYLEDRGDAVVEALRVIAGSPGATVVHCAAGKDRTGTIVALALDTVGVDRDDIVADYARSAERIELILGRLITSDTYAADLNLSLDKDNVDRQRPRAETMAAFFTALDTIYDGPAGWLAAHGWRAEDGAAMRHRLLDLTRQPSSRLRVRR